MNISQVPQSVILSTYVCGEMALNQGLIPGSDMTCEAAVAKLSYLASVGYKNIEELDELIQTNLRG